MNQRSTSLLQKGAAENDTLIGIVILCVFAIIIVFIGYPIYAGGISFFFERHEASQEKLVETEHAQKELSDAILNTFGDWPRLEVKDDYSVHAYISKNDYYTIPYPDRGKAITSIVETWCSNNSISDHVFVFLPIVYIQDIKTGDMLARYSCFAIKL